VVPSGPRERSGPSARVGRMVHPDNAAPLDVVVLGGGGHVGLPLSLAFASAGLHVGIYDINEATLERIGRGEMPFLEHGADQLLADVLPTGLLELSSDPAVMARADTVVVVIGTPVDEFLGPSMRVFERAVDQIAPHVRDGALIVLRSTVYPGTSEYVAIAMAERGCRVRWKGRVLRCRWRGHAVRPLGAFPLETPGRVPVVPPGGSHRPGRPGGRGPRPAPVGAARRWPAARGGTCSPRRVPTRTRAAR